MREKPNPACPNSCLCEHCARTLTCVDCIYFPWSSGKGCSQGGTSACRYKVNLPEGQREGALGRFEREEKR